MRSSERAAQPDAGYPGLNPRDTNPAQKQVRAYLRILLCVCVCVCVCVCFESIFPLLTSPDAHTTHSDKVRELGELLKPAAGPPATERKAQKRKRATSTTQLNGQSSGSNDAPRTKTASQRTTQIQVPRPSFSDKTNPSIAQIIAFLRPLPDDPFSPENAANRGASRQNTSNVGAPRQPVPMPRFRSTQIRAIPVRSVPRGAVRKRRFETQCEFWLRGHCEKGDSCPFSHPVVRPGANGGQGSGASRRKRMAAATAGTSAASADATGLLNPFSSSRF